jgi:predicted esterase
MDNTPLFLGCSDADFHIAKERVLESAEVFRRLGADVTVRLYPNMGHTINDDEIAFVKQILTA